MDSYELNGRKFVAQPANEHAPCTGCAHKAPHMARECVTAPKCEAALRDDKQNIIWVEVLP